LLTPMLTYIQAAARLKTLVKERYGLDWTGAHYAQMRALYPDGQVPEDGLDAAASEIVAAAGRAVFRLVDARLVDDATGLQQVA